MSSRNGPAIAATLPFPPVRDVLCSVHRKLQPFARASVRSRGLLMHDNLNPTPLPLPLPFLLRSWQWACRLQHSLAGWRVSCRSDAAQATPRSRQVLRR